ncbi:MAG: S24 family peptidase [Candidatus Moranbacteria bacterium]|nr:S24 family peptidase [Candidatus Moranbacteria bacterium]
MRGSKRKRDKNKILIILDKENIEMVSEKAKAGYRTGFADPEFIKVLPTFQMPFLSRQKKYRSFQISGDSMLPIPDGSWVVCEFVQDWTMIQNRYAYVINTIEDGVVFKVAENLIKKDGKVRLHSLNTTYPPYDVNVADIREVWKFVNYISSDIPPSNQPMEQMAIRFQKMERDIQQLKSKVSKPGVTGQTVVSVSKIPKVISDDPKP